MSKIVRMLAVIIGPLIAMIGVFVWLTTYHHKMALGLLGLGILLLVLGTYAAINSGRAGTLSRR